MSTNDITQLTARIAGLGQEAPHTVSEAPHTPEPPSPPRLPPKIVRPRTRRGLHERLPPFQDIEDKEVLISEGALKIQAALTDWECFARILVEEDLAIRLAILHLAVMAGDLARTMLCVNTGLRPLEFTLRSASCGEILNFFIKRGFLNEDGTFSTMDPKTMAMCILDKMEETREKPFGMTKEEGKKRVKKRDPSDSDSPSDWMPFKSLQDKC